MNRFVHSLIVCLGVCVLAPQVGAENRIQIQNLSDFSLSAYGLKPLGQMDLWTASEPDVVFKLMDKIANRPLDKTLRARLSALLAADTGNFMWEAYQNSDAFLVKRMQTLFQVGDFETVVRVIQSVPVAKQSDALKNILANALLMQGKTQAVERLLEEYPSVSKSDEKRIGLLLLQNQFGNARLQYEVYRENQSAKTDFNQVGDAVFRDSDLPADFKPVLTPEIVPLWFYLKKEPTADIGWVQAAAEHLSDHKTPTQAADENQSVQGVFSSEKLHQILELKPQQIDVYPMDMYRALKQAAEKQRRGEAVLWGILLLSQSDFYRSEIIKVMDDMTKTPVLVSEAGQA